MMHTFLYRKIFAIVAVFALMIVFAVPGKPQAFDLALIEPVELSQTLSSWTILDARPKKEWRSGHIPGAVFFSWEDYTRTDENGIPFRVLPPDQLAEALGGMGIGENSPVVVYGDADTSWGGEGWSCWVLLWLGHKGPVRLLNGGIQAWTGLKLPVRTGNDPVNKEKRHYHYQLRSSLTVSADDIRADPKAFRPVDTRSTREWIFGRLPGAKHIFWEKFFTGKTRRPLGPLQTAELLAAEGVKPGGTVVYYCTGGVRSGYAWLVHTLAGLPQPVNFEGGIEEWNKSLQAQ